jgi:hypothetical protein
LYGIVTILTGLVPEILHLTMDFPKEVLVGLVFHDEQFTPSPVVTGQLTGGGWPPGRLVLANNYKVGGAIRHQLAERACDGVTT